MINLFGKGYIGTEFVRQFGADVLVNYKFDYMPVSNKVLYTISTTDNYNVHEAPHLDIDTNLTTFITFLENMRKVFGTDSEITFLSSWFVYGAQEDLPVKEDASCHPKGFYSITKYAAEMLLESYCNTFGMKYRILRLCNVIGGGTPSKKNVKYYNGTTHWATVRDMKVDIIIDTEHKITDEAVKKSSTNIIPKGNVIIATRVGLGKVCIIKNDTAINQDLKGVIPKKQNQLLIDFLFRWFKSISNKIINEGTGATVQGVKLIFIKSLPIYLPTLKEQKQIVKKLDAISKETKRLEEIYIKKVDNLEELKKSILQKAFNGEL